VSRDEIYLASFPFGGSAGMKLRPVLLLTGPLGSVPEVLVAYISSVIPPDLLPSDVLLDPASPEHASSHLKTRSVLRLHKLATIHERAVVRRLGAISGGTASDVREKLRAMLDV
jgi:mRNA interferase MazF